MRFNLDQAFGIHQQALLLRAQRAQVLAENLSNADTPRYQARDIDFRALLNDEQGLSAMRIRVTDPRHISANGSLGVEIKYRNPLQPSLDGNTVDAQIEKGEFIRNAIEYQASLKFLSGRIKSLLSAIKGE